MEKDTTTHKQKALSITTVAVEIKVMTVDGKRMSKAVFDQIPKVNPIRNDKLIFTFRNVNVLGYVRLRDDTKYLLFSENGQLCKWDFSMFFELANHPGDNIDSLCWRLDRISWDEIEMFDIPKKTNRLHFMSTEQRQEEIEAWNKHKPGSGSELYISALKEAIAIRRTMAANRHNEKLYRNMWQRTKRIVAELEGHQIYISI